MSDSMERFEEELHALRPRGTSADLKACLGEELARKAGAKRARDPGWVVWPAMLAAACVLVWIGMAYVERRVAPSPQPARASAPLPATQADALPTVRAYDEALARSDADFDALLTRHSKILLTPVDPAKARAGRFMAGWISG